MGTIRKTGLAVLSLTILGLSNFAHAQSVDSVTGAIADGGIILDAIENMGERIWKLVEKGKAVVHQRTMTASALPQGVHRWDQLTGYKVAYMNTGIQIKQPIGGTVINYDYRLVFTYNGSLNGKGKYIGYATIEQVDLNAKWLAPSLDVYVSVPTTFNAGTAENPIAAMKIDIHIRTKRLQVTEMIDSYIITGNGKVRRL